MSTLTVCMCFVLSKDYLGGEQMGVSANQILVLIYPHSN